MKNKISKYLLGTTITLLGMRFLDLPLKNEIATNGIVSFELAGTLQNSIEILNSWDTNAKLYAGLSLGFDYLFMLMYSLLLYQLINYVIIKIGGEKLIKYGSLIAKLMIFAGILDAIENYALIKLYLGNLDQIFSTVAYYSATIKFALIGLGLTFILIGYTHYYKLLFTRKN